MQNNCMSRLETHGIKADSNARGVFSFITKQVTRKNRWHVLEAKFDMLLLGFVCKE
jgi:hypothetical protein